MKRINLIDCLKDTPVNKRLVVIAVEDETCGITKGNTRRLFSIGL
jgi:sensor histidine kinase regulating citrate/malate metabolism